MNPVFVDTGAWNAIEDGGDQHHTTALRCKDQLAREKTHLYVTNFVLDETYTLLLLNVGHTRTVAFTSTPSIRCRQEAF